MRILLPVFFHSAMGGLHLHILASVRHLRKHGHDITVVSKPGPFADEIRSLGGTVIETDYTNENVKDVIEQLIELPFDVVYAHPFNSRQLGVAVAEAKNIPFVLVIHGMYHDDIDQYHTSISKVIAVSDKIAEYLVDHCPQIAPKVEVILNGVSDLFQPKKPARKKERLVGMFSSRIDPDKLFILDVFLDGLKDERVQQMPIDWYVIGDGTQREKYEARYKETVEGTNQKIEWLGWLSQEELPETMSEADFIIAPGRAALEAMAVGKPTIAVGSKGYHGLITPESWRDAAKINFGGIGKKYDGYKSGSIGDEIKRLQDESYRAELSTFSAELVDQEFRDVVPQTRLEQLLQEVIADGGPAVEVEAVYPYSRYEQLNYYRAAQLLEGKLDKKEALRKQTKEERDQARKNTNQVKRDLIAANRSNRDKDKQVSTLETTVKQLESEKEGLAKEIETLKQQLDKAKSHPIGKFFM